MPRITLKLRLEERDALFQLAAKEYRDPRAQAVLLIRRGLESAGYLPKTEMGESHESQAK